MKMLPLVAGITMVGLMFGASPSTAVNCALYTNAMYKAPNSKAVYYITPNCQKQVVKNPDVFFSYVAEWSEVRLANPTTLATIPDHQLRIAPWGPRRTFLGGTLVKSPSDPRVFLVSKYNPNGQFGQTTLVPFESEKAFTENGYQWSWVEDVSPEVILNLPISGFGITADWHYYPAGILYKHAISSALYLGRSEYGKNPVRTYIKNFDELNNLQYRFDRVPNFPTTVPYVDSGTTSGQTTTNNQSGPQDSATCADTNSIQSGSVLICQGVTVRVNSYLRIKVAVVTANDAVISLIKNNGSTQVWTIPVGKSRTGTFFEDPNNNLTIYYDQYAYSSALTKPVAYLRLITTAIGTGSVSTPQNCQNYNGQDGVYKVCANNTIYQSNNYATYTVNSYTSDTLTISYSIFHSGNTYPDTGTMIVRNGQTGSLQLPWAMRTIVIGYQGKDSDGRASVVLSTQYDQHSAINCSSSNGGDGEYTLCLGQQLSHASGATFRLRNVYTYLAKIEINNVYETSGSSEPQMWSLDPSQTTNLRAILSGGVLGSRIQVKVVAVGSDYITLRVQTL